MYSTLEIPGKTGIFHQIFYSTKSIIILKKWFEKNGLKKRFEKEV
jgi:hypothetical protein